MRITLRLILSLVVAATAVVAASTYWQVRREQARMVEDLHRRSEILADTLQDILAPAVAAGDKARLEQLVGRFGGREHLKGVAVFDAKGAPVAFTPSLVTDLPLVSPAARRVIEAGGEETLSVRAGGAPLTIDAAPLAHGGRRIGALTLVLDSSFIEARVQDLWQHNFIRLLSHAFLIALISLWIIRWNVMAPVEQLAEWMKSLRIGKEVKAPPVPRGLFEPLALEASKLAKSLAAARTAAETEAAMRRRGETTWTPEKLKEHVKVKLGGRPLFVVANREPYMNVRKGKKIAVITPASGLVTGLEPILLACGGLWVAHGSGDADRETVDKDDKLAVPPGAPQYTLKRVWLTKEEEEGYYYGFSNEGLWPLCHIAHTRPVFKASDWEQYEKANRKFADALLSEMEGVQEPCVLIQDYHFALLPRMVKEARPDARVAIFWHIPWPNPEAFGICPWQKDILTGLLGADLIGFHVQFHCNNFLETVDRFLESVIDWEGFAVQRGGQTTVVKPFPISIAFPTNGHGEHYPGKEALFKELGVKAELMGVGVDRLDYTKGIIERFRAVERLLEKNPAYQGRFTFVEVGAPSRVHIPRYRDLMAEIETEAERINWRFHARDYKPIVLLARHHSHAEIEPYYRAADVCMVTSLHDGMNLVAKEFAASREDLRGSLILSRFTGAARELRDALVVNPYDIEQLADSLHYALEMDPEEQGRRMAGMRQALRDNNVYAWAAKLIDELAGIRAPEERHQPQSPGTA